MICSMSTLTVTGKKPLQVYKTGEMNWWCTWATTWYHYWLRINKKIKPLLLLSKCILFEHWFVLALFFRVTKICRVKCHQIGSLRDWLSLQSCLLNLLRRRCRGCDWTRGSRRSDRTTPRTLWSTSELPPATTWWTLYVRGGKYCVRLITRHKTKYNQHHFLEVQL